MGLGDKFLVAEAAVDIHMRMKGAPCSSPAVGVGPHQTQTVQRSAESEGPPSRQARVLKSLAKTGGTRAVCRLLHSLGLPDCKYYRLCY